MDDWASLANENAVEPRRADGPIYDAIKAYRGTTIQGWDRNRDLGRRLIDHGLRHSEHGAGRLANNHLVSQPGGPTRSDRSVIQGLSALFDEAGLSGGGSPQLALVLTPLMSQIKGSVGPDFVIPCVDFELDVTLDQTARGATADCQRMVWGNGRWMIGPGSEPATPPSVWPDTDLSFLKERGRSSPQFRCR